ncbi:MAG TPA: replicative DNA helicase [Dehalococcoidia bacterium]|nr:replicative DNA helicase [Dehalococcoidia bacterium]
MFEQLPPHDIQAEEAVVASLMVDEEAVYKVAPILKPQDFFRESNGWTYEACLALWERNETINQVTVAHELDRRGRLEEVGGLTFLSELVLNLPTPIGVEHYAQIVKRDATYRQMIEAATRIAQIAYQGGPDLDAALSRAESVIYALRSGERVRDFVHISEFLDPYLNPPDADTVAPFGGNVRTGLSQLDLLLGGLNPSDLIIVAARTGVGKTSLMLNFARNAAVGQGAKVAIFSLEMAGEQLAQRLLAAEARVDSARLRLGMHNEVEESRIMHAHGILSSADIYVDDSAALQIPELRAKTIRLKRDHGLDLIIVDYLQLIHGNRSDNRVQEISYITRSLKELARELDVPIVAGSQLSRAPEQRQPHIPMLSDLRESGSIEQDADVVIFIYREEMYIRREEWEALHPDRQAEPYPQGKAQIIVAKHRNGPTGVVEVRFRDSISKFEDFDLPSGEPPLR